MMINLSLVCTILIILRKKKEEKIPSRMFSPVCLTGIVPPNVHCACIHVGHIICPVYWKWDTGIRSRLGVYILLNHFIYCKIKTPEN